MAGPDPLAGAESGAGPRGAGERTQVEAIAAPRSRWRRRCLFVLALLLAYPVLVVGATYTITLRSGLPGSSHGPCDAYRHSLASALVAYTLSPRCVRWVTDVMERGDGASHRMDAHNNQVGVRLAGKATSLVDLLARVRTAVDRGREISSRSLADGTRVVWLAEDEWAGWWW